jgi:hypothetical protein
VGQGGAGGSAQDSAVVIVEFARLRDFGASERHFHKFVLALTI